MTHVPGVSGPARAAVSAALALLLLLTGCSGSEDDGAAEPPPSATGDGAPGDDPSGGEPERPGRLVSSEPYDGQVPAGVRAWHVRYTTTDAAGELREATGLVVAPEDPAEPAPVVATAHGTTGLADDCAPSTSPMAQGVVSNLAMLAQRGWVGVAPDYAGLGSPGPHHYLVGRAAAHDLLDSVRSARELVPDTAPETVMWGHSQGGHAVLWAGQEASSYAPEVELAGVAATGAPTDLRELVRRIEPAPAGMMVAALVVAAWDGVYPDARLLEQVPERGRDLVRRLASVCTQGQGAQVVQDLVRELRGDLLPDDAYDGRLGELLEENSPSGRMDAPLLVGQGRTDGIVLAEVTRGWVARLCADGGSVDYREYPMGHNPLGDGGRMMGEILEWAEARIDGESVEGRCP